MSGDECEQHQTRRQFQILFEPTRNFMGIQDDIVNVSSVHPRPTKPHHTRTCFLTVPRNAKVINQRGCQYCPVSEKRCLVMNVTDNEPVWRRAIDHSSFQNRTSEPKSRSLNSVRVQTNEEKTVAIEFCGSLKTRVNPNRSTEGSASGYSRN